MAWSAEFIEYISGRQRSAEVWLLEVYGSSMEPSGGDGYTLSSCRGYGDDVLIAEPPRISGPRVTPVSWSSTIGEITVELAGDITTARQRLARGTICRVLLGRKGWQPSQFEVVGWGQVTQWSGGAGAYQLTLRDPLQVLRNRLSTTSPELFSTNGTTTQLDGAITDSDTTITVDSTAGLTMDANGSGYGAVLIGSEIVLYTGQTATTLTGCVRGALGSTAAAGADNDTVTEIVYLNGHPLDIVRRLLLSHNESGNSAWDDYEPSWGLGIRQTLVDLDDIDQQRNQVMVVASGTYEWGIVVQGTVDDPASWLSGMLSQAGVVLTVRQGLLTARAASMPLTVASPPVVDIAITDSDLVWGFGSYSTEAWASESDEYVRVTVYTQSGDDYESEASLATLPAAREMEYHLEDLVRANEAEVRSEVLNRLAIPALRVPEAITLTCAGMRMAQLAPLDVVYLQSEWVGVRFGYSDGASGRRCLVVQVSPDWAANTVTLRLLCYPVTVDVFE